MNNNLLLQSFQEHCGFRGVHFYTSEGCRFLSWDEVVSFTKKIPKDQDPEFENKLLTTMANYDPDLEFLALGEIKGKVSIELYEKNFI